MLGPGELATTSSSQDHARDDVLFEHYRSLPCGRYLLASLTGNEKGARALWYSELSLHQLSSRLYIPIDNTPLHSLSSVCHPWGTPVVVDYNPPRSGITTYSCLIVLVRLARCLKINGLKNHPEMVGPTTLCQFFLIAHHLCLEIPFAVSQ